MSYVPDWPLIGEVLKAGVPSIVAIIVAYIAWQQWRTAKDKLAIDLFDRRFAALNEIQKSYIAAVTAGRENHLAVADPLRHKDHLDMSAFDAAVWNARWLFGERINSKLRRLSDLVRDVGEVPFDADDESDPPERYERFEQAIIPAHDLMYEVVLDLGSYMMLDKIAVSRPAKAKGEA